MAKDAAFYHFYQSYEGNSRSKTSNQLSPKETAGPPKETAVPDRNCRSPIGTAGPRRGPTFNNRWWNDRRSWNLRTTNSREKASPKGANHIQSCSCSPPSGTVREYLSLSAGSIPFGHSTSGYSHSPPLGTEECDLRNLNYMIKQSFFDAK